MDDDVQTRGYWRRRARLLNRQHDRCIERNEPRNESHLVDEDDQVPLMLSLYPPLFSSQISPLTSSLRLAPPSPSRFLPSTDLMMAFPYHMVSRGSSSRQNQPLVNFISPSDQTTPEIQVMRPITTTVQRNRSAGNQRSETITPPFPWATDKRGEIHSLEYLETNEIFTITGDVKCKHCEKVYKVSYNLRERFAEVEKIFLEGKRTMRERALPAWKNPEPWRCEHCGHEKSVKPVIAERKRDINWLFMLLGQTLGYCTLQQLKNFCKHCKCHRTGAKDRVLYLTYLGLCKMLQPDRDLFNSETGSKP